MHASARGAAFLLLLCVAASASAFGNGCLQRFHTHRQEFARCREKPCFIFLSEPPFVLLDKSMKKLGHAASKLFACGHPKRAYRHLSGSAFEVLAKSEATADALCVWGGPECPFNKLVDFIDTQAKLSPKYKFGATGLLLENDDRLRENVTQSVSLMQEQLAIFGEIEDNRKMFPVDRLLEPFTTLTWFSFVAFSLAHVVLAVLTARVFGPRAPRAAAILHTTFHFYMDPRQAVVVSEPHLGLADSADMTQSECELAEHARMTDRFLSYKVARLLMRIAVSAMVVIFLLFYEVAVVNFLFVEQSLPLVQDVTKLTDEQLKQYAVEEGAATESVWQRTVTASGQKLRKIMWKRCKDLDQCFDWALDKNNTVKFVVGFKSAGLYQMSSRDACQKMTIYETRNKLYSFGAGWLYGNFGGMLKRNIDKSILDMHEEELLPDIMEAGAGKREAGNCRGFITDIDVGVIGASVVLLVLPNLLIILGMIACFFVSVRRFGVEDNRRRRRAARAQKRKKRQADIAIELEGFDHISKPARAATYSNNTSSATLRLNGIERMQTV